MGGFGCRFGCEAGLAVIIRTPIDFDFFEMMSGANEQRALGGVGEVNDLLLAQIKNKELMGLMTSMALIDLSVCREKKNPPREPARRVDPVDWVGWL